MKRRRRGGGAAPRPEACDVWLDTAELKQSPAQSLIAKPKVSMERKLTSITLTQTRFAQPRSKQTTISMFFCTQTDEKDKENTRPSPFILNKDSKEKGTYSAASPVKILALPQMEEAQKRSCRARQELVQVPPQHRAQTAPASLPAPLPDLWSLQAEPQGKRGAEESCCFSFTQDSEGNPVIAHRHESDLFAGEMVSASGSVTSDCGVDKREVQPRLEEAKTSPDFQPRLGVNQSKNPHQLSSVNSLTDFSETENINPALTQDSPRAAQVYSSPQRAAGAEPLRERSQNAGAGSGKEGRGSPCRQLFTQDSEGNRVIAHHCWNVPSRGRDQGSSRRKPPHSPCRSSSGEQQLDMCYDLFTQDSEGNRVIKHW